LVQDENCDLLADSHGILNRWKNYFCQVLSVHGVNDVGHTEINTAEPLVLEPNSFEFELGIEKLKRYNSPGNDEIPAKLIQAGDNTLRCEIHKLTNSVGSKEEVSDQLKDSVIIPVYRKRDEADCFYYRGMSLLSTTYKILSNFSVKVNSIHRRNYWRSSAWILTCR
jgi:hypothetical protein